ncbi:MAG: pyruvate formate lyase family protein, partial [Dehalococcoidia bacterium]|nr:pyruvate formate lyase family protein [Dehalococcoidia bacterium]
GVADYSCFPHVSGAPLAERIINKGLRSFLEEAEERKLVWEKNKGKDIDKFYFWQACSISLKAAMDYSKRYARCARQMALVEKDETWRAELEEIARICEWVPENPARTFREALQSLCMIEMVSKLETPVGPFTGFGLMDQYLHPYLINDLDNGRLTVDDAVDLMADFLLFANHIEYLETRGWREGARKGVLTSIGLAGPNVGREEDGSNETTYLILHAVGLAKYPEPHIAFRWSRHTPRWIILKALETNVLVGGGVPQFQNSDQAVEYMVSKGVSREKALGWITHGCSQGNSADQRTGLTVSRFNIPLCVDLALHNGVATKTGKRIGIETGDPRSFKTFDEMFEAFKKQLDYVFTRQAWLDNMSDEVKATCHAEPFASALLPGCLENGHDFGAGGLTHYRLRFQKDRGIVPTADSLLAIRKLVYEDKKLTMDELLAALDTNFEGSRGEAIRRMCLAVPKYGNDEDAPDLMARDVAAISGGTITSQQNAFGYPLAMNRDGQAWHFFAGKRLAALPNGRKSGEVLSDGSLSPMQGMDRKGPTALLNSVLKVDSKATSAFAVLNVKLTAGLVTTPETRDKVADLIESFFKAGGTYIQFNILDAAALKDARLHPEKYRDLVVRVGGYSAYFVNLSPEVQDEIIRRTEYKP